MFEGMWPPPVYCHFSDDERACSCFADDDEATTNDDGQQEKQEEEEEMKKKKKNKNTRRREAAGEGWSSGSLLPAPRADICTTTMLYQKKGGDRKDKTPLV